MSPTFPARFNLAHYYLDARLEEGRGDRPAVIVGDEVYRYEDVARRSNRARAALEARGIDVEDRVLMLLFDGVAFVEAWFGVLKNGSVFCMANPLLTADDMDYLLGYTRCRAVIADAQTLERLGPLMEKHPRCRVRMVVGAAEAPAGWERWEDALDTSSDAFANADTSRDDIAGWLFTSGTTGKPKGAVHLHRHFAFNTEVYAKRVLGLCEDDVFVSVSRLFFGYGTGTNLMFPFAVGGTAVLFPEKPTAERLFDHIEAHGVTVLTNVPAMIRQMCESERDADLSKVRICLSAGEALPAELYQRWKARWPNAEILDGIGSAEMFHIYITNRLGDVKLGSLGRIVEGYEAKVMRPDGTEAPPGEIGRLHVRGDSTALCYWGDQDKSRATFHGEWCVTADLFRCDEDGYYYYAGRDDDMLKVRGQFVSPLEIEDCLATHDSVKECAVVGVDDGAGLVVPMAFVVLREGVEAKDELVTELQEHAKTRLTRYKFPRRVAFVDSLPRNDRGKIMRRVLQEQA
ncbi:MAG: benzoate-CoA ligase family protein [Myxococcota bacterium]